MNHSDETSDNGPIRTCIGCRQRDAKRELLRVTAGLDEHGHSAVLPDPAATTPGRGAHLHPAAECYDLAVRRQAFGRALRLQGREQGTSSTPVGEYVAALATPLTKPTRNRSSSS